MDRHGKILLVDDATEMVRLWQVRLAGKQFVVSVAASGEEALAVFPAFKPDVVLTELELPGMDGLALFKAIRELHHLVPVLIVTAHGTIPKAIEAIRQGVFSFLTKPVESALLLKEITRALELTGGGSAGGQPEEWRQDIISQSTVMETLLSRTRQVARTETAVLIQGESGTGKELLAIGLHKASQHRYGPFVPMHCGIMPETVFESELFWAARATNTHGARRSGGLPSSVGHGTLFLDEIETMPLRLQVKLLRVLQERRITPAGARSVPVHGRILAATRSNLAEGVQRNTFREDLYRQLHEVSLELPPLRERREDIPLLVEHCVAQLSGKHHGLKKGVTPEAMRMLMEAPWPGNVRQLYHVVEHAAALATGPLLTADLLPEDIRQSGNNVLPFAEARRRFEQQYLIRLLRSTRGNVAQAAALAQRNRTDFYKLLGRHHLNPADYKQE